MTPTFDAARARRYLLGDTSDQEASVIEHEYFERDDAIDSIAAVEDDLIEDYLADQLSVDERERFESVYLASVRHRTRVEAIRRLAELGKQTAAATPSAKGGGVSVRVRRHRVWLALAASLILIAAVNVWLLRSGRQSLPQVAINNDPQPAAGEQQPAASAPARTPVVFALTLSPVAVRSSSETESAVVPQGTDVVAIDLEGDADNRSLIARRASVKTVAGREIWRGPITTGVNLPAGIVARIEVPAEQLPAEDYLVTLYGTDRTSAEQEWAQYYLRVRNR
jgi:hypothetical protein